MTRITTTLVVVLLLLNGTVTVVEGSGLAEDAGVELAPGISERMESVTDRMQEGFSPNIGVIQSFIALGGAALGFFQVLVEGMFALPTALKNMGLPAFIVDPLFIPLYLISSLEAIYVILGRELV